MEPGGDRSQCVTVDFSAYPDSIITVLHLRDALWHSDSLNVAKHEGNRLFLNQNRNDYYELHCLDHNKGELSYFEWAIEDLMNEHDGIISKDLSLKKNDAVKWQFVFGADYDIFSKIDTSAYKRRLFVMTPVHSTP